jgi:hypothetical protein
MEKKNQRWNKYQGGRERGERARREKKKARDA